MSGVKTVAVKTDEAEMRVDRWFRKHFPGLGHGRLEKLLRKGEIRVDGKRAKSNQRLKAGQQVRVPPMGEAETTAPDPGARPKKQPVVDEALAEELRQRILFMDDDVIALDKPAGLATQGGTGQKTHLDAMLDALRFDKLERPKLVHRLDKDTSGVLLIARSAAAARWLTAAFRAKTARKIYWALVVGEVKPRSARIDLPIAKLPGKSGEKMAVDFDEGKKAQTDYEVVEQLGKRVAWVALSPITGRTHQLRVHMMERRTPIVGDGKYGGQEAFLVAEGLSRKLHLHAREVEVTRPNGSLLRISAPLPDHMMKAWQFFGFDPDGGADALHEVD
ncbi:RluA family pseudouridine synthase [Nisaea acidiphila]|uniref:Pseudouridine synthase n=1 Tax=Nisaea acidiphila TaxID=1862145 RepID=A0A9J7ANC6_9PROT|nr:RluA family pseudouridine synthase [Nisaea acidiphila]UUX48687.1 RluA family pseudouridine synthase [Nisaea acidiphila]